MISRSPRRPGALPPASGGSPSARLAPLWVPISALDGSLSIADFALDRGLFCLSGSGSGKSTYVGGTWCFQSLSRGQPQVLLDPMGPMVDSLIYKVSRQPEDMHRALWSRIVYVDMSGRFDRTVPFPLLYTLPGESLRDAADRFLESLRKIDPALEGASIQGWNALVRVGRPALMVLAALGLPVTAGEDLLFHPERWESRFLEAVHRFPEVQPAVSFLQGTYLPLKDSERLALASSFLTKLAPFSLDPILRDMFATTEAAIDLRDIVEGGKTLLLDFRNETNRDRRRFKTRWVYEWFLSYVRFRGAGRHQPIQFVIDELTELTNQKSDGDDLFTRDLDELVNVTARNCSLQLLLCTQGLHQLSPTSQKTLLGMGNIMLGVTSDMEAAKLLAEQFLTLDPERVKRYENVWGGGELGPFILDQRIVDMPLEEQVLLGAQKLMRLKPFQFLVRVKGTDEVKRISTRRLMGRGWASDHPELLALIRHKLSQRVGVPRIPANASQTPSPSSDTLKSNNHVTSQPAWQSKEHTKDDWSTPHRA